MNDLTDEFRQAMTHLGALAPDPQIIQQMREAGRRDGQRRPVTTTIGRDAIPPAHRVRERIDNSAYVIGYWFVAAALVGAFALGVLVGRWVG